MHVGAAGSLRYGRIEPELFIESAAWGLISPAIDRVLSARCPCALEPQVKREWFRPWECSIHDIRVDKSFEPSVHSSVPFLSLARNDFVRA